mgnify:CR=1 FL=1
MNRKRRRPVAILGATGMVGRRLAELLVDHPQFELALLVGSGASEAQSFESVWTAKEEAAHQHYGETLWKPVPYPLTTRNIPAFATASWSGVKGRAGPSGFSCPSSNEGTRFLPEAIRETITASCNGETET